MFKLYTKLDADFLLYLLSHFECDGYTGHVLTQWRLLPPPQTSTVKSSLFTHVHSSPLSLAARLHDVAQTILIILTMVRLLGDRPHICIFIEVTLVNKIIEVSGAQFYGTSPVCCTVCSPPQVRSPSITIYLPITSPYPPTPFSSGHHCTDYVSTSFLGRGLQSHSTFFTNSYNPSPSASCQSVSYLSLFPFCLLGIMIRFSKL